MLPAQTVFEHNDITGIGTYTNDGLCAMQRFIEPVGEARSDYTIEQELARRLGGGWLAKHKSVKFVTMEEPS